MSNRVLCTEPVPPPCGIVIFGASGDLTARKIVPSLFHLYQRGVLSDQFFMIGCARSDMTDEAFRNRLYEKIEAKLSQEEREQFTTFLQHCGYVSGNYTDAAFYQKIAEKLQAAEQTHATEQNRIFYLSTPPQVSFEPNTFFLTNH